MKPMWMGTLLRPMLDALKHDIHRDRTFHIPALTEQPQRHPTVCVRRLIRWETRYGDQKSQLDAPVFAVPARSDVQRRESDRAVLIYSAHFQASAL